MVHVYAPASKGASGGVRAERVQGRGAELVLSAAMLTGEASGEQQRETRAPAEVVAKLGIGEAEVGIEGDGTKDLTVALPTAGAKAGSVGLGGARTQEAITIGIV